MINKKLRIYSQIINKIKEAKNIALISHLNPDLDTIWSALWFYHIVNDHFENKKIDLVCKSDIPQKYNFLNITYLYKKYFNPDNYDLIIFLDSSTKYQTDFYEDFPKLYDKTTYNTINIDHHKTNELYSRQNILNIWFSSTTMIIFEIFYMNKFYISPDAATCLLAWIYTDTWVFQNSNVDKNTFFVTSKLKEYWANSKIIIDKFFKSNTLSTLKLWWKIINDSFLDENKVLYSYVNQTILDSYESTYDDVKGVLNYLNMIEEARYTTLLTQKWEYIKWSLRTLRDDIDLTKIAKKYDWWWHKKASWFTTTWKLESFQSLNFKL